MTGTEYDVTISLATMWADVCVFMASCVEGKWVEWLQCCKEIKADIAGDCLCNLDSKWSMWYLPLFSQDCTLGSSGEYVSYMTHIQENMFGFVSLHVSSLWNIILLSRLDCIWLNMRTVRKMWMSVIDGHWWQFEPGSFSRFDITFIATHLILF